MNEMIGGKTDNKNIGLLKNLFWLRQTLDVSCLIRMNINGDAIAKMGCGKNFFPFLEMSCQQLITLLICKVFEEERLVNGGKVHYELDSIGGVLRSIDMEEAAVLDPERIREFIQKYGSNSDKDGLTPISAVVKQFRAEHCEDLTRFKDYRDKHVAHPESEFSLENLPSYDRMEQLFDFGQDFYMLVSRAFVRVVPADLNSDRKVRTSLKGILQKLGCEDIKTEMT